MIFSNKSYRSRFEHIRLNLSHDRKYNRCTCYIKVISRKRLLSSKIFFIRLMNHPYTHLRNNR